MAGDVSTKPSNKERVQEIVKGIEAGIRDLFQSDKYADYLRTMSRFHSYSLNNTLLIHMQKPDATLCAGFQQWKKKFERHVKRGERGITVIAPTPIKKKMERDMMDPDTNLPMRDAAGNVIREQVEISIPMYKPVKVFDVSQTEGKPLPELASPLNGDVQQYEAFMEALRRTSPVPISFAALPDQEDGLFSLDNQSITIREGMSQVQTVCATVHEIAHSVLHNQIVSNKKDPTLYTVSEICNIPTLYHKDRIPLRNVPDTLYRYEIRKGTDVPFEAVGTRIRENFAGTVITMKPLPVPENGTLALTGEDGLKLTSSLSTIGQFQRAHGKDRNTQEVEAESVSYAVCQYFGIETGKNSFGYIATWSKGKELKELRSSLETITKTANFLITNIEKHFQEICKQRGIKLDGQTVQAADKETGAVQPETAAQDAGPERRNQTETAAEPIPEPTQPSHPGTGTAAVTQPEAAADSEQAHGEEPVSIPDEAAVPAHVEETEMSPLPAGNAETVADTGISERAEEQSGDPPSLESAQANEKPEKAQQSGESVRTPDDVVNELEAAFWDGVEPLDQPLDQYPMPDEGVEPDVLTTVGYHQDDLLPVSRNRACELLNRDMSVYMLLTGENPEMAFDTGDIQAQPESTFFAVPREEWEASPDFQTAVDERLTHQEEREKAYTEHAGPCFALYRLREDSGIVPASMRDMKASGNLPDRRNYDLIYTGELAGWKNIHEVNKRLTANRPPDFRDPAPGAGDVVVIKNDNRLYCDYIGSQIISEFSFSDFMRFVPEKEQTAEADRETAQTTKGQQEAERRAAQDNGVQQHEQPIKDAAAPTAADPAQAPPSGPTVAELEAQVKAGQSISLMALAEATHRESDGGRRGPSGHAAKQSGPLSSADKSQVVMPGPSIEAMDAAIKAGRSFSLRGLAAEEARASQERNPRKESILSNLRRKLPEAEERRNKPAKSTERGL